MKKAILLGLTIAAAALNTACAHPHYYQPRAYYPAQPVYQPPVYCAPPPVYYAQPPVYCAPRPCYNAPVYYGPSIGVGFGFNNGRSFIGFNIR